VPLLRYFFPSLVRVCPWLRIWFGGGLKIGCGKLKHGHGSFAEESTLTKLLAIYNL
jgi:hypothetical protein